MDIANHRTAFLIQCLVFCIPINIYIIGDWMGVGIQWALFRYQQTYLGTSLISFTNDIAYVHSGIIQGRSAVALLLWGVAVFLLIGSFSLNVVDVYKGRSGFLKYTFSGIIISGLLFLFTDIIQYGPSFHAAAGTCIPVGIPILVVLGLWGYHLSRDNRNLFVPDEASIQKTGSGKFSFPDKKFVLENDLVILLIISVFVKFIIFFGSLYAPFDAVTGDIELYYHYSELVAAGQIPYLDFNLEYPALFFIPALLAYIPVLVSKSLAIYMTAYMSLMYLMDMAMLCCVYDISLAFFGPRKAFLCSFLYTTAFTAAFYAQITYDIVPAFLLVFSLVLYIHHKTVATYISVTAGALVKWFPALTLPLFILHAIKDPAHLDTTKQGILFSAILALVFTLPIMVFAWPGFLFTYVFNISRAVQTHSFVFYCDTVIRLLLTAVDASTAFLFITVLVESLLYFWYFRSKDTRLITLCYCIFLSVFFFVTLNKNFSASYIVWLTPFLAIFLAHTLRHILVFYAIQGIIYIETPLLYRVVYGNDQPYAVFENGFLSFSFVFYTVKFILFFLVLWIILHDMKNEYGPIPEDS